MLILNLKFSGAIVRPPGMLTYIFVAGVRFRFSNFVTGLFTEGQPEFLHPKYLSDRYDPEENNFFQPGNQARCPRNTHRNG